MVPRDRVAYLSGTDSTEANLDRIREQRPQPLPVFTRPANSTT
jgi:CBS domain containing-hemolysin-like protein